MVKSLWDEGVESVLAGMPARPVTAVMPEGDCFDQGDIDTHPASDRCCDLSHLQSVGQSSALVICGKDDNLGFAGESSEGRRVHDSIAVTLKAGALVVRLLRNGAITSSFGKGRAGSKRRTLVLLAQFSVHN
jgi:hypothetical protein